MVTVFELMMISVNAVFRNFEFMQKKMRETALTIGSRNLV